MILRLLLVAMAILGAGAVRAAPLEAYGQLPSMHDVVLSPDGAKIAFSTDLKGVRTVLVQSVSPAALIGGLKVGDQPLRVLTWAGSDHLLLTTTATGYADEVESARDDWSMTQNFDIAHNKSVILLNGRVGTMNVVSAAPEARTAGPQSTVILRGYHFPGQVLLHALFAVDAQTNDVRWLEKGGPSTINWLVDSAGQAVAETDYDEAHRHWSLKVKRGGKWVEGYGLEAPLDLPRLEGFTPDGASLILTTFEAGHPTIKAFRMADGSVTTPSGSDYDMPSLIRSPATNRLIGGARTIGARTETVFFDPKDQAAWNGVLKAFPGEDVELVSWTEDRGVVVVLVTGSRNGAAYQLIDLKTGRGSTIDDAYAGIGPADIAQVKAMTFKAADGLDIPGLLTLPNGRAPTGLPLVVLPHDGPADHDTPSFYWLAQALASRGYAVLQPQYRGSDGSGWALQSAGFGQWGRKMQTDLSDGVRALAAQGVIDPKRVCIVGLGVYGGYAAVAGMTLDPGVYRCAAAYGGIFDMRDTLPWQQGSMGWASGDRGLRLSDRLLGISGPHDPELAAISPYRHADKASGPILLVDGLSDTVSGERESRDMADALKRAGKPVELLTLPGEDHWLSHSPTRLQMLFATVKFLEANNPPG